MQLVYNSKILQSILDVVSLKGKWLTSTGLKSDSLGEYVKIIATSDTWRTGYYFINGNAQTFVNYYLPAIIEEEAEYVIEIAKLQKYLKTMKGEVSINISEGGCQLSCENKKATMPIAIIHPHEAAIDNFFRFSKESAFYGEELEPMKWGKTLLLSAVKIKSKELSNAISACETVGHGIYKFEIMDGKFTITSTQGRELYSTEYSLLDNAIGEATVDFTGPMHKGLSSELSNIHFNDDSIIVFTSDSVTIARAPYVVV